MSIAAREALLPLAPAGGPPRANDPRADRVAPRPVYELLTPAEYRAARRAYTGGYGGIGVLVLPAPGGLLVRRTVSGPARIAGIKPGDTILAIDGAPTAKLSFKEAIGRILGRAGSRVSLRVRRDVRILDFKLVRRPFSCRPCTRDSPPGASE